MPVVMTGASDLTGEVNDGAESQWGGLVISGLATQNNCNIDDIGTAACTAEGEGASGYYGGTDDEVNSGTMAYFQVGKSQIRSGFLVQILTVSAFAISL